MRVGKQLAWGLLGVLAIIAMVAPLATAAEIEGTVQSIDMNSKAITLGDGTTIMVVDAAQLQNVKPGMNVKASYEERAGQKIATSIKVERKGGASMPGASPAPTTPRTQ
jgi:Cu/Ag efflux protein CusF